MTQKRKKIRRMAFPLLVTLILSMVLAGCVVADQNIRRIGFGETTPAFSSYVGKTQRGITIRLLGGEAYVDFTPCIRFAQGMAQWIQTSTDTAVEILRELGSQVVPPGK